MCSLSMITGNPEVILFANKSFFIYSINALVSSYLRPFYLNFYACTIKLFQFYISAVSEPTIVNFKVLDPPNSI